MIGFFIKKAFFDGWDNLIGMILQNLIYIVLLGCILASFMLIDISTVLFFIIFLALMLITCIFLGGTSSTVFSYSNYQKETWSSFGNGIRRNIRHSLLFFLVSAAMFFVVTVAIPFYAAINSMIGTVVVVVLFWVVLVTLLALPYYFPLMNLLPGDRPFKTLKKCFIILGDNLGLSLFFLLYNIVIVAFSVCTMGMVPGVVGYMLASQDFMKLLMFKYDYLEMHPDVNRRKIPWYELLYDEKEKVGPRSLRSMIFPWKY